MAQERTTGKQKSRRSQTALDTVVLVAIFALFLGISLSIFSK